MIFHFEDNDRVLGQASLIVSNDKYVRKHFFRSDDSAWYNNIMKAVDMMFLHHGDELLHSVDRSKENMITVCMHYIDHNLSLHRPYAENIENYLKLVDTFGFDRSKRDLQWYNIIYRKEDDEHFLIDWDNFIELKGEEAAYKYYKSQLSSYKWQELYNVSQEDATALFDSLWRKI